MDYLVLPRALFAVVAVFQIFLRTSSCEPSWSCYEGTGSCYYFSNFTSTQLDASCWCQSSGGHLVKIDSNVELDLLRELMASTGRSKGFYIGATDLKTEGQFIWEDGSPAGDALPWYDGEHNNRDGIEHCAAFHNRKWWIDNPPLFPDYKAFDIECSAKRFFVCENDPLFIRQWKIRSRNETYRYATMRLLSVLSVIECASHCQDTCGCRSFAYRHGQDGGNCLLQNSHFSRLMTPQHSPGFAIYD